jgi:hypothetical protein
MVTIEATGDELIIRVPRKEALAFSALAEDSLRVRGLPPNETDFRQRVAAAVAKGVAEMLRRAAERPRG